jgi:phosphohistidine phosphatase
MKKLMILRHAKAEPHDARRDHQRELTHGGREDAVRMGAYLADNDIIPQLVLCSDAARARQTLEAVAPYLPKGVPQRIERKLYDAESSALLGDLRDIDDAFDAVMFIGHNPGLEDLARGLVRDPSSRFAVEMRRKFPTAALAVIDLDIESWADLSWETGHVIEFVKPADL